MYRRQSSTQHSSPNKRSRPVNLLYLFTQWSTRADFVRRRQNPSGTRSVLPIVAPALAILLAGCVSVTEIRKFEDRTPIQISGEPSPVMFTKLVSKLSRGQDIGTMHVGVLCVAQNKIYWKRSSNVNIGDEELADVLKMELVNAGYKVVGESDSLFEHSNETYAEYLIGGIVRHTAINICFPRIGFGDSATSSGEASIEVEWQVFDRRTRSVVLSAVTGGTGTTTTGPHMGIQAYYDAFAKSVRNLLADSKFVALISQSSKAKSGTPL